MHVLDVWVCKHYVLINLGGESLKIGHNFATIARPPYYPNAVILVTPSHIFVNGNRRQAV